MLIPNHSIRSVRGHYNRLHSCLTVSFLFDAFYVHYPKSLVWDVTFSGVNLQNRPFEQKWYSNSTRYRCNSSS